MGYRLRDSSYRPFNHSPLQAHKISFKIINSTTLLLPQWREHVANTAFKDRVLPRDVATQWNSTYNMLAAFLEMKEPVSQFLDHSSNGMAKFLLDNNEWTAIEGLVSALKILKDATTYFSSNAPIVAAVIPAMDAIDEAFATGIIDQEILSEPIRHMLSTGKKTLNKYYTLTDDSDIYRMAMSMDSLV
ncbi:hypothetical protein BT96DRAFT_843140 [Gymnopus androsaceus JB14]|uniref:Uncharacterized protein n=1 Tax=Gymnopus androsaceus JB14 TaxID=1447944 RepID=A0A6A4GEA4_9AGAR|nr:hypothetical protein BT96DRAFT_843140 [Gymnopus androsaceus JB14]